MATVIVGGIALLSSGVGLYKYYYGSSEVIPTSEPEVPIVKNVVGDEEPPQKKNIINELKIFNSKKKKLKDASKRVL